MIHPISNKTPERERPWGGPERSSGERFSLELANHRDGGTESVTSRSEVHRVDRRRALVRFGRRPSEIHRRSEQHQVEEIRSRDGRERSFGAHPDAEDGPPEGEEETQEAAKGQREDHAEGEGRRTDLWELQAQLSQLQRQPQGAVTLFLPSLGRVTARSQEGGIAIELAVPLRQLAALQRSQDQLLLRLQEAGLRVAGIALQVLPAFLDEERAPLAGQARRSLVDVLA